MSDADDARSWRAHLGLTQEAAAAALGVSRRTIAMREAGERALGREAALAMSAVAAGLPPWTERGGVEPEHATLRALMQYREILRRSMPTLSRAEWGVVLDALNGADMLLDLEARPVPPGWLYRHVHDCLYDVGAEDPDHPRIRREGTAAEKHPDAEPIDLLRRLARLSYAEEVAVVTAARDWWAAVMRGENPDYPT